VEARYVDNLDRLVGHARVEVVERVYECIGA